MLLTMRVFTVVVLISTVFASVVSAETVFWYIPHPDDESIGMADAIHDSVLRGATNYVIFFSQGGASLVRYGLRAPDGKIHSLTREELKEARMEEALAALEILGVHHDNVLFLDFPDGNIPLHGVIEVMNSTVVLAPDALHCTVSITDPHEDHRTLAKALAIVNYQYGNNLRVRYYRVYAYNGSDEELIGVQAVPVRHKNVKQAALNEYLRWEPDNGRYALGGASMHKLILNAAVSDYEYMDDILHFDPRLFGVLPIEFCVFNYGIGVTINAWSKVFLDVNLEFSELPGVSTHVLYEIPSGFSVVRTRMGVGISSGPKKWYGVCHLQIVDSLFLEYSYCPGDQGKLKLGIKTRLWL